jgi:hypothetical protein
MVAAAIVGVLCGCAEVGVDDGWDASCDPSACAALCVRDGWGGGVCADGVCRCGWDHADGGEVEPDALCEAVACHAWCVARGADRGFCRGDECRCDPPVDPDAGFDAPEDAPSDVPAEASCGSPGTIDRADCERCGTRIRTCRADGSWTAWGDCEGMGECEAGEVDAEWCERCGSRRRTCTDACEWPSAWGECEGMGECEAGEVQTESCDPRCGTRRRTCTDACEWPAAWGSCTGTGECEPGSTQAASCDRCSQQVCGTDCRWAACTLLPGSQCEWRSGTHWRCCGPSAWQYCLSSCVWSTACAACGGCGC